MSNAIQDPARTPARPAFYSGPQLRQLLGISNTTMFVKERAGAIPSPIREPGCRPRWPRDLVDRWVAAGAPNYSQWAQEAGHAARAS